MVPTHLCALCRHELPFDAFYKKKGRKNDLGSYCKKCSASLRRGEAVTSVRRKDPRNATAKRCPACEVVKTPEDFNHNRGAPDGRDAYCTECRRALMKTPRNTALQSKGQRKRLADPEKKAAHRRSVRRNHLRRRYDLTIEDYDGLLIEQSGRCALCLQPAESNKWLAIDHDHNTKAIRGLLCVPCNVALERFDAHGQEWVDRAVAYLAPPCGLGAGAA